MTDSYTDLRPYMPPIALEDARAQRKGKRVITESLPRRGSLVERDSLKKLNAV